MTVTSLPLLLHIVNLPPVTDGADERRRVPHFNPEQSVSIVTWVCYTPVTLTQLQRTRMARAIFERSAGYGIFLIEDVGWPLVCYG